MANRFDVLLPVTDPGQISRISLTLHNEIERGSDGVITLLKQEGWVAAALPSSYHLSPQDQMRLWEAIEECCSDECWCVTLEPLEGFPSVVAVPSSREGIKACNDATGHFNAALFSGRPDWVVACTTDEYFMVAGPRSFVRTVGGGDVEEAIRRFHQYADDPEWEPEVRRRLLGVLGGLREYAVADPGAHVRLG